MKDIFISYSRKDQNFVRRLSEEIERLDREAWVDWEDMPRLDQDWLETVYRAIEGAHTFVLIMSPHSVRSKVCCKEVRHAFKNNKRMAVVVIDEVDEKDWSKCNPNLRKPNWFFFRNVDDFSDALNELIEELDKDLDMIRAHTFYLEKTVLWDQKKFESDLLRGESLQEALEWLARTRASSAVQPTELMLDYIKHSQQAEAAEVKKYKELYNRALAKQLAAQAELSSAQNDNMLEQSVLLAIESMKRFPSMEAERPLRSGLNLLPNVLGRIDHSNRISGIEFTPDGEHLVTSCKDGTVRVSTTSEGLTVSELPHMESVNDISIAGDNGELIAIASDDRTVQIWDWKKPSCLHTLSHKKRVKGVSFVPCRTDRVVTSCGDKFLRIWDLNEGREIHRLKHSYNISQLHFSTNGKWLITLSGPGATFVSGSGFLSATVWEVESAQQVCQLHSMALIHHAAFSLNNRYIVTAEHHTARVWSFESPENVEEIARLHHGNIVNHVAFSPHIEGVVATASWDCKVRVWDIYNEREVYRFKHEDQLKSVYFNPVRPYELLSTSSCSKVWDIRNGIELSRMCNTFDSVVNHHGSVFCSRLASGSSLVLWSKGQQWESFIHHEHHVVDIAFSLTQPNILATASFDRSVRLWSLPTGELLRKFSGSDEFMSVALHPSNQDLIAACSRNIVFVWNSQTGKEIAKFEHPNNVVQFAFHPNARLLATAEGDVITGKTAHLWDVEASKSLFSMNHDKRLTDICFNSGGRIIATSSMDKSAKLWDAGTGNLLSALKHNAGVGSLRFHPKYDDVLVTASSKYLRLWDLSKEKARKRLKHRNSVDQFEFSYNGALIVSRDFAGEIVYVWDFKTGDLIRELPHDRAVMHIACSLADPILATLSYDRSLRIWDLVTGTELARLPVDGYEGKIVFSADGLRIGVLGGFTNFAMVTPWRYDDLVSAACAKVTRNLTESEWRRFLGDEPYEKTCATIDCPHS